MITSFLRQYNIELSGLIHTGISASGRTRKSPLDGFTKLPKSKPPHYVFVQHTTVQRKSLSNKWLNDRNGDIFKAFEEGKKIKEKESDSIFTLYLTTNQILDKALCFNAYQKGIELGLDVQIIENTIITDFLDNSDEGHWLRKEFLGISDIRLSMNRFKELCLQSMKLYEENLFIYDPSLLIKREVDSDIFEAINKRISVICLVGEPGIGKSSIAHNLLKEYIMKGYGMWIPAEKFEGAYSWETVLSEWFKEIYSDIESNSGKKALTKLENNLLLILDDINRINNPQKVLDKIITWFVNIQRSSSKSREESNFVFPQITVVIPLWPYFEEYLDQYKNYNWISRFYIGLYSEEEAKNAISKAFQNYSIASSDIEIESFSKNLGYDPFLIRLFIEETLISGNDPTKINFDTIMESFISKNLHEISNHTKIYIEIIDTLSYFILKEKNPFPQWHILTNWFSDSNQLRRLEEIINHGKICYIQNNKFNFRHDRLRDFFLSKKIQDLLKSEKLDEDVFFDPYYAPLIGKGLSGKNYDNIGHLNLLLVNSPLTLFEYLRCEIISHKDQNIDFLVEIILNWLNEIGEDQLKKDPYYREIIGAISWILVDLDSKVILEITEKTPHWPVIALARLRNGSIDSGIRYCRDRCLETSNELRDKILDHINLNHREGIVNDIKMMLSVPSDDKTLLMGLLFIIGFLRLQEVEKELRELWERSDNEKKGYILADMLWTVARCFIPSLSDLFATLIQFWNSLSKESIKLITERLHFRIRDIKNDEVYKILIKHAKSHINLRNSFSYILDNVDSPMTIRFIVEEAAEIVKSLKPGSFSPWVYTLGDKWNNRSFYSENMSLSTKNTLFSIWNDNQEDREQRKIAFRLWLYAYDNEDLDLLANITKESPLYYPALYKRVEMGDLTSIQEFSRNLKNNLYWLTTANKIWCDEIKKTILDIIKDEKDENFYWSLAELLTKIPEEDAEEIILTIREKQDVPYKLIQAALFVGTEVCLDFVKRQVDRSTDRNKCFKHISHVFLHEKHRLTFEKLQNLLPFIKHISSSDASRLTEFSIDNGYKEWSRIMYNQMEPLYQQIYYPTDDELYSEVKKILELDDPFGRPHFWVEKFDRRKDTKERLILILERLLKEDSSLKALRFVSNCLQMRGNRNDMILFEREFPDELNKQVQRLKKATSFSIARKTLF